MRRNIVFMLLISLVITLTSCQKLKLIYGDNISKQSINKARMSKLIALTFTSGVDEFDLATADVVVVNPVRTSTMTVVTFIVSSAQKLDRLNKFFIRHQGQSVDVAIGQDRMKVKMMVHKPLHQGRFKIYIKNSDEYALRFIDNVLVRHLNVT